LGKQLKALQYPQDHVDEYDPYLQGQNDGKMISALNQLRQIHLLLDLSINLN
jgi:hypothetical protein